MTGLGRPPAADSGQPRVAPVIDLPGWLAP